MTKAAQIPFPFYTTELAALDSANEPTAEISHVPTLLACTDEEWEGILENLRERVRLPRGHKVEFRRADPDEDPTRDGWTTKPGRRLFEVVVCRELTYGHTIDVLIHEVAHVLNWQEHTPWRDDHSATFGVLLAEVYCAYHQVR